MGFLFYFYLLFCLFFSFLFCLGWVLWAGCDDEERQGQRAEEIISGSGGEGGTGNKGTGGREEDEREG